MGTRALSFACIKGDSYNYFVLQYRYLYELHQYINTSPSIKQVRDEQHYPGAARRSGDDRTETQKTNHEALVVELRIIVILFYSSGHPRLA